MSAPHLDQLFRYERGESDDAEARAVERALAADPDGRAELAWIRALRAASAAQIEPEAPLPAGIDAIEIAALCQGTLTPERAVAVRAALARTPGGIELVEAALAEVRAVEREGAVALDREHALGRGGERSAVRGPRRIPPAAWAAAAAAAAALLAFLLLVDDPTGERTPLARREPIPVTALRGDEALARGRDAYAAGLFAEAEEALRGASAASERTGEALLYLGSAILLQGGRDAEASEVLKAAADRSTGSFAEEARWQRAQALLALGRAAEAEAELRALARGGGHRAADARAQLELGR